MQKAIEMYNRHGIEYVGVRELAKELEMKGGNITYYFPTKETLVLEITSRVSERNSEIYTSRKDISLFDFLGMHREIYRNQYQYRCIILSLPHLLQQTPALKTAYRKNQIARKQQLMGQLEQLTDRGYLRRLDEEEAETLFQLIAFQNRLWITEARADGFTQEDKAIDHYLRRMANLMSLVATAKGKKEAAEFVKGLG